MNEIEKQARELLVNRRRAILQLFEKNSSAERELFEAPRSPDWADRALAEKDTTVLHNVSEGERIELNEIEASLRRIEAGTYGDCEQCGSRIGRQRLRAIPEARRCISCTEALARP
ncbi:MAG: TraR/DksA C4-type zinc finger protein [Myxococcaceae bacterium]|nr:TraR/DksA C4-type zinc finger protein [Myxococcaceae bacterium]